jgi:hypothetical protein
VGVLKGGGAPPKKNKGGEEIEEVNRSRDNTCCHEDLPTAGTAAAAHVFNLEH